jgi:hypothetical protein
MMMSIYFWQIHRNDRVPKGSFGSYHLELESNNLFIILTITCFVVIELVMEFHGFSSHA